MDDGSHYIVGKLMIIPALESFMSLFTRLVMQNELIGDALQFESNAQSAMC